jgi:uncharacterized membrane protein YccC
MAVMAGVALLVGMLGVLRGYLASAQTVLLLSAVLAVTSAQADQIPQVVLAWLIGGALATTSALVLWPARPYQPIHAGLAVVYRDLASAIRMRWGSQAPEPGYREVARAAQKSLEALHKAFDGNLQRPAGLTTPDRALSSRVDIAERLCLYQEWVDVTPADAAPEPQLAAADERLATAIADELVGIAEEIEHQHSVRGAHPEKIFAARTEHLTAVSSWVEDRHASLEPLTLRRRLDDLFPLRMTSVSTELAGISTSPDFDDPLLGSLADAPRRGIWHRLMVQTSWDSPWLRLSIRTALALAASVGIANALSLQHSFWIVLGALVALRFDALGTGRTALQAFLGTTVGAALGSVLILAIGDTPAVWAALLPLTLFIAAYTPSTFSLGTAQASFTVAIITLFSLLNPATLKTAELRVIDVAIGLVVSLGVSTLIWPRGIVAMLHARCVDSLAAATDYLMLAFDFIAGGAVDTRLLHTGRDISLRDLERAQEAFDLTVTQRPPEGFPLRRWARVISAAQHADACAHVISASVRIVEDRGGAGTVPATMVAPVLEAAHSVRRALREVVDSSKLSDHAGLPEEAGHASPGMELIGSAGSAVEGDRTTRASLRPVLSESVWLLRDSIDDWLADPDPWPGSPPDPRPATLSWVGDLVAFVDWTAQRLVREQV